jgi:hypothetical protein
MQHIVQVHEDITGSATNEAMSGGDTAITLPGKGPCVLKGMWTRGETTARAVKGTFKSPSMAAGDKPYDFPVLNVQGTGEGDDYISFGPGQKLPENETISLYGSEISGNDDFMVVTLDFRYNEGAGGQFAMYRITPSADVTARTQTKQSNVLSGKLDPSKTYHIIGIGIQAEEDGSGAPMGLKLEAPSFNGLNPGMGGAKVLPENMKMWDYYNERDGLKHCPKIKGNEPLNIYWLCDAASKPIAWVKLWTP